MNTEEIRHFKSMFIKNPNMWEEYSSAAILEQIKNTFTQRTFDVDKWHDCDGKQLKTLNEFMDRHIYETI